MSYFSIPLVIMGVDQLTKAFVEKKLKQGERFEVIPNKLYITNVKNKGAAMGFMEDEQKLLHLLSATLLFLQTIIFDRMVKETDDAVSKVATAFVIGGGLGNMVDRMSKKQVTDFVEVKNPSLPIFNIADVFILFGTVLTIVNILTRKQN